MLLGYCVFCFALLCFGLVWFSSPETQQAEKMEKTCLQKKLRSKITVLVAADDLIKNVANLIVQFMKR